MSLDIYLEMELDTGGEEPFVVDLYSGNITRNLGKMASECGLYQAMWEPEEIGLTIAGDLVEALERGLAELRNNPDKYKEFNPPNGWGDYDGLLRVASDYLEACREHPKATVRVWR